jgi:hypothetical protein
MVQGKDFARKILAVAEAQPMFGGIPLDKPTAGLWASPHGEGCLEHPGNTFDHSCYHAKNSGKNGEGAQKTTSYTRRERHQTTNGAEQ